MEQIKAELFDFLEKALLISRDCLKLVQDKRYDDLAEALDNREKVINIITYLHEKFLLHQTQQSSEEVEKLNTEIYMMIERIHSLDDIITNCLEHEKGQTQMNIATTFRTKETFKGYNLKTLK